MNVLRKLGWAAALFTAGSPPAEVSRAAAAPEPEANPSSLAGQAAWSPHSEREEEDEFEGEGWSFWGW